MRMHYYKDDPDDAYWHAPNKKECIRCFTACIYDFGIWILRRFMWRVFQRELHIWFGYSLIFAQQSQLQTACLPLSNLSSSYAKQKTISTWPTDNVLAIQKLWLRFYSNLRTYIRLLLNIVGEQLYPYTVCMCFTQYIPSKPAQNRI